MPGPGAIWLHRPKVDVAVLHQHAGFSHIARRHQRQAGKCPGPHEQRHKQDAEPATADSAEDPLEIQRNIICRPVEIVPLNYA